jgi:nitrogen regulatory protein PII
MKLVIIFLNKIEYLEDLLSAFLEIGVTGATVIDSVGMGRIVSQNIPIFAGLGDAFPGTSPGNKTIFTVVSSEMVEKMADVVQDICGNFEERGSGLMITLPVDAVYGLKPGLE